MKKIPYIVSGTQGGVSFTHRTDANSEVEATEFIIKRLTDRYPRLPIEVSSTVKEPRND